MGTNEPDNLFFGMTNPAFAANIGTFWLFPDAVDETVVPDILLLYFSTADVGSASKPVRIVIRVLRWRSP
ncbi:hypothetical protein PanWU01x14_118930 [Parasponia andersonii]|uniref:Uncharacterized protein n=1 Tax=Parasponia andersonii TaxID=3476 RepID=A0A2P5CVZ6_PARAD|nr:hypothetical protein PanWU01x14_118930 [Parasponia andersonii]